MRAAFRMAARAAEEEAISALQAWDSYEPRQTAKIKREAQRVAEALRRLLELFPEQVLDTEKSA